MKTIHFETPGEASVLHIGDAPEPHCGADDVLIDVHAAGVNRADTMQRRGLYPPPPGASPILGLEVAGLIAKTGANVTEWSIGQPVMALLSGGGYAEQVAVPRGQVMAVPAGLSLEQAAGIPEVFLTAYLNLFWLGGLPFSPNAPPQPTKAVLIHGGASGIGTAALQLCRAAGLVSYCTVGADERVAPCLELGASAAWNYRTQDFVIESHAATQGRGIDLILDCVGGSYLERNLAALALDGRIVCIGLQGGLRAEIDLAQLLRKRAQLIGSTLRALPIDRKALLCRDFIARVLPLFADGTLRPIIDTVLPLAEAAAAHTALEGPHVGKVLLKVR